MAEVVVTGSVLSDAAAWVSRMCPAKPTIPVLAGMLLDATADELRMTAYDYETAASARIPAVAKSTGRMLVSGRLLAAVAKTVARDVNVAITGGGGHVRVVCGKSEWTLPSLPIGDYPAVPGSSDPISEVRGDDLRRAIGRVLPAADRKGTLPVLGGVQLSADGETLTLTATDRFRLATVEIPWKPVEDLPVTVVPASLLDDAVRAIESGEPVRMGACGGSFTIATDTHTLTGRTIGETFPAWQKLMPTGDAPAAAVVESARLALAADQAMVAISGASSLRLDFGPDRVLVSAGTADTQTARAEAPLVSYTGDPMPIAVNPQYLKDALNATGSPLAEIRLGVSSSRPILILPVMAQGEPTDPYRHLLMPVKLS